MVLEIRGRDGKGRGGLVARQLGFTPRRCRPGSGRRKSTAVSGRARRLRNHGGSPSWKEKIVSCGALTARLLKLTNVSFAGHHMLIDGALGEYSLHLGSGTVHRRPSGAICIIPVGSQHRPPPSRVGNPCSKITGRALR
jgi:hypothetical protein